MSIEIRSNCAVFRRAEQLKRWEDSETNSESSSIPNDKSYFIKFSEGCVFLAACAAGDCDEVEHLLQTADINTSNVDGLTALHQACIDNNLDMVQFLIEHNCDVNIGDNEGWTPLHATASCGFLSIAKYLVENNANPASVNNDGDLPIDIATAGEMKEYLSSILDEKGINCDEARSEEETVMLRDAKLMLAKSSGPTEFVHERTGATPLHVAAAKEYIEVVKLLIQAGVDLNAQDVDGWTPLHAAAHWGQKEACALLADSLANMDIQNFAGQTCFDVADSETLSLLEELKEKQVSRQQDQPEIRSILERTSNKVAQKRRTSVTRMSGQEKSKSVMKDTKYERDQIENISLHEEETDEEKEKRKDESIKKKETLLEKTSNTAETTEIIERIPSWKKVLRRSAEESTSLDSDVAEIVLKRPKKLDTVEKSNNSSEDKNDDRHTNIPSSSNEESELQRKAHAKRVRETRRSTQGVLLEDVKTAELQFLRDTQQKAAKRQLEEAQNKTDLEVDKKISSKADEKDGIQPHNSVASVRKPDVVKVEIQTTVDPDTGAAASLTSWTLPLRTKPPNSADETILPEGQGTLGTPSSVSRRKRPKRRSTGVVNIDPSEENEKDATDSSNLQTDLSQYEPRERNYTHSLVSADIARSSSIELGSRTSSKSDLDEDKDYKKLYLEVKKENTELQEKLQKVEEELDKTKSLLKNQENANLKTFNNGDKKERRAFERRISELEEEAKQIEQLKLDNDRLKEENSALIRVISKLSK